MMIEINLLPEDLRSKQEKPDVVQLRRALFFIVPAAFGLLVIIHLCLGGALLFKSLQYKSLNKRWAQLGPQRQKVEQWKKQHKITSQQTEQMYKLLVQRITVADKMQALVQALPNGIWFNQLSLKQGEFNLKGSVVSLNKGQMNLLNIFLKRLKEDKLFFKHFNRLELGRMSMRTLGAYSIMDFALEGYLE